MSHVGLKISVQTLKDMQGSRSITSSCVEKCPFHCRINHSWLYHGDLTPDHSCQHVDHHGHSRGPLDRCLQSATLSACLLTAALQHCSRSPCVSWGSACWGLTGSCHWNCSSQCSVSAQWPASNIHQTVTTLAQCTTASILHFKIILN